MRGKSSGECREAPGKAARCARCARGKKCRSIPASVLPAAKHFLALMQGRQEPKANLDQKTLRATLRALLAMEGEDADAEDDDDDDDERAPAPAKGKGKGKAKAAAPTKKSKKAKKAKKEESEEEDEDEDESEEEAAPGFDPEALARGVAAAVLAAMTPKKKKGGK
ncbi:uncharacterized protein THITE_2120895 [Thermothielavioides terrestris NRRL 8126]|uniref:Uncharacterized protein n=1 Tax=Thermothielavioides terrestris (strain ATCC 38088 / NRRL 8126) TaxID=578455 RepID=G2RE16_THETT|nr:uncharacterized protein THITE_2108419 [Thermothielavioides terrestris NRRL 8126]XP_003649770.1 uncharacterized protein THITE_2108691 [Thermothielavioides terrestris NRRL 8126]XP_003652613.1 uncharacterized protein THITE_2114263 [Thermothielavioides terrestris NRRL 8126]XP_003653447.1 uncharacterized protein THITE_2115923 [Thermothielavioides terrestris NRRL 8126]XP_003656379.1 uncharacterized protein THITE_2120889 [Thermothielavioides terrestris NRRL 8126]XP_003656381.1 uncharacterized prot